MNNIPVEIYNAGSYSMTVRAGSEWDKGIIHECQEVYWWNEVGKIDTAIDVGAHIGGWTRYAKHLWSDAEISSIEVEPDNAVLLRANTAGLEGVLVYQARCGYGQQDYQVAKANTNTGGNVVVARGAIVQEEYTLIDVPQKTVNIEQMIWDRAWLMVDVLKLDCEGAEVNIINGMEADTLANISHIVGEIHYTPQAFEALTHQRLTTMGYKIAYVPTGSPTLWHFHAVNQLHL